MYLSPRLSGAETARQLQASLGYRSVPWLKMKRTGVWLYSSCPSSCQDAQPHKTKLNLQKPSQEISAQLLLVSFRSGGPVLPVFCFWLSSAGFFSTRCVSVCVCFSVSVDGCVMSLLSLPFSRRHMATSVARKQSCKVTLYVGLSVNQSI